MKFEGDKMIWFNIMIDYVIEEIHNLKNNEKKITYFIYWEKYISKEINSFDFQDKFFLFSFF